MPMTVREAERLLISIGFIEVKGGKGSHRKFEKAGERPITLTSHNKELSKVVEKTVKAALGKARGK
ncbi:type II toxin-antitoxin system HicA family toxin [Enterococcus timonensis]|uniref:type II toxin-antitoxin system HicA family toxin n=1 Tax=Enterococcus timonensis TaxID=1852364 RepID=UPI0008D9EF90|nr:type II toxin-antitoxin system HicA family toxin [Enterococcus timonensis]